MTVGVGVGVVAVVMIVVRMRIGSGYLRPRRFQLSAVDAVSMARIGREARTQGNPLSLVRQPGRAPVHLKRHSGGQRVGTGWKGSGGGMSLGRTALTACGHATDVSVEMSCINSINI